MGCVGDEWTGSPTEFTPLPRGNGDGRFLYPPLAAAVPGKAGTSPVIAPPVSSIRWEILREGVKDYEYLYRLCELLAQHGGRLTGPQRQQLESLLDVPPENTCDMTTFTTDSVPLDRHRRAVAAAIENRTGGR
jgi:hypothetical protein